MNYLTLLQHRELPALPVPRPMIKEKMLAFAALLDGPIDLWPDRTSILPAGCWWLPAAQLVLCGTACAIPLMLEEVGSICLATGLSGIIVRYRDEPGERDAFTFDVFHQELWHPKRLLSIDEAGAISLVSSTGVGAPIPLGAWGLGTEVDARTRESDGRCASLDRGREYLAASRRR